MCLFNVIIIIILVIIIIMSILFGYLSERFFTCFGLLGYFWIAMDVREWTTIATNSIDTS